MPAIPVRRDRPTVYLDTSHLNRAHDAIEGRLARNELDAGHALVGLVEEIARDANLVLSCIHLVELAQFAPPDADANTRARLDRQCTWLESLDHVFVRAPTALEKHEWRNLLLRLVGANHLAVEPFTPSIFLAFGERWTPNDLAGCPTIVEVVDQLTRRTGQRPEREFTLESIRALQEERARVYREGRADELRAVLAAKRELALLELVRRTDAALTEEQHEGYLHGLASLPSSRAISDPVAEIQDRALTTWRTSPRELRLFDLGRRFHQALEEATAHADPSSNRSRERYASSAFDLAHAQAGAYCDVFTCDRRFADLTAGARESWGLQPPICGSLAEVVALLRTHYVTARCTKSEGQDRP